MLTLSLLRHAKSSWDDPDLDDRERPLAKRGTKDAARMGAFIAREELAPDLMLCSDAVRARATLMLALSEMGEPPPEVRYTGELYLAPAERLLELLRELKGRPRHLMVVGHNPGLFGLALTLAGAGKRKQMQALASGFPTASLAVIDFDTERWADLRAGAGRLRLFTTPRLLR